ncbi:Arginine transport system permease protein ArtQ [Aedoeadaptatus ivorii]|uniref:Arginine transport system permease protein ArtQ n=1 Tax=Aedoeadaptatus ivorii TaxID=54006 RepID=A0A3S4ZQV9_9FIRM|nr:amino acid ABC transporter permease [Peptoniphilus ivorii]MDQ0508100.1 His/Glu/Gln/Arg/opine family amino acid ABC transporter permease subunit [Peptoniphilus ivorii]VEJ35831.1 Arginine transport system permease protein ArtQ [Peptoniphilus ivorii]
MNVLQSWFAFLGKWGPTYLSGMLVTLKISFFGVLIGFVLGLLIALMRRSRIKPLEWLAKAYVEVFRGTPLLVQVLIAYYGFAAIIPETYGSLKNPFVLSMFAICMNSSAYVSEIIRGGINAVDRGQGEAAASLGMTKKQTMRHIILPQAVKTVLPALGNEFVTLIKESAIVAFVGIEDIMFEAKVVAGATYLPFMPYITAALIYFVLVFSLSKLLGIAERRMANSDSRA